jgi:hypothetical protein
MVIDHKSKIIYLSKSQRTNENMVKNLLTSVNYYKDFKPIFFDTKSSSGLEFYHTNVVMSVGEGFVVICLSCVTNSNEKKKLLNSFKKSGLKVIDITLEQTEKYFCGNLIQLKNKNGESLIGKNNFKKSYVRIL